jgi:hypothetical protein
MAVCVLNFIFHVLGFSVFSAQICAKSIPFLSFDCETVLSGAGDAIPRPNGFHEYLWTIKIQILLCVCAFFFLTMRRVMNWIGLVSDNRIEEFGLFLKCLFFPLVSTVYVFSGDFLAQWTVERPPWFFAGMMGLLMMGSLTMLFVCVAEPSTTLDEDA